MEAQNEHLESLKEIRSIMEKSSQFLSLSGLSGVFIGITALIGSLALYFYQYDFFFGQYYKGGIAINNQLVPAEEISEFLMLSFLILLVVLVLAIAFGIVFTTRNAHKKGLPAWSASGKRMVINLFVPLAAGGLFCLSLLFHGIVYLIPSATLIFYGLALFNAGKYTHTEIRYLGIVEVTLGIIASIMVGYGLVIWAIGFGLLHIIYGLTMYFRYERINQQS